MSETLGSFDSSVLAALGQAVIVTDLSRRIIYWNKAAEERFGWSAEEALGKDVVEIIRLKEESDRDARLLDRLAQGETVIADYWMVRRDGTAFVSLSTVTPLFEHGRLKAIVSVGTDITERRVAEDAMRHLAFLVGSALDAIVGTDLDGRVTVWNEAAERLYGYSASEAIGSDVLKLVRAGDRGGYENVLSRWRSGDRVELEDFPAIRRDGTVVEIYVTISPVHDATGAVIGSALIARDVTERKELERAAEEDRRRLTEAQEVAQLGSYEIDVPSGHMRWSLSYRRLLGIGQHEPATIERFLSLVHTDDQEQARADLDQAWLQGGGGFAGTYRIMRSPGEARWLQFRTRGMHDEWGTLTKVIGTAIDVTDRYRMEEARRDAEERFRLGFERGAVATAIIDLDGTVTSVNPVMCKFLDHEEEDLVGHLAAEFVHLEDQDDTTARDRLFRGDLTPFERRFVRHNGTAVWGLVNLAMVRHDDGRPAYFYVQVQDISERKVAEQALEHMALHDPLTGLPNRLLLQDRLEGAMARADRYGQRVAVIFGDIDRFKLVNDTLGHSAGDQLLVELAHRLEDLTIAPDTVGRFGGDEFVMICEDVGTEEPPADLGRRFSAAFDKPFRILEQDIYVSVSCGVVVPEPEDPAATTFRNGDAAMHRAKELGRSRTELFDSDMLFRAARLLDIEGALRLAVANGDLRVAYQPLIDLTTGKAVAVEALCRWHDGGRGDVPPTEFIRVAEQSALIHEIGRFVIDEAVNQMVAWREDLPGAERLWVSINLSAAQLSAELVSLCQQLLQRRDVAGSFGFEITESVLMEDIDSAIEVLRKLRQLGIPVSIDDFGTGYSSLEYLKRLPVQSLKIDKSFVAGLGASRDPDDPSIVQAIVSLAKALSLKSCAEGVETADQLDALRELGCELGQGFLWAEALDAERFEAWYGRRSSPEQAGPAPAPR